MIENHEYSLFKIIKQLEKTYQRDRYNYYLCDIKKKKTLKQIFKDNKVSFVYHAAAYKHVELLENNIFEAIYNNVLEHLSVCMLVKKQKLKNSF